MAGPRVEPDMSGLATLLQDGLFSDVTIELADGTRILAHRNILAAASDVLRAKFSSPTRDAEERVWRPEHGSAEAWRWIVGWIYGKRKPLPWDLVVEVLVLADYVQLKALLASLANLDFKGKLQDVAHQLLDAKDCPLSLNIIAAKCVPAVTLDMGLWTKLLQASLSIVRLFFKFLELHPLLPTRGSADEPGRFIEECVLMLVGARLRAEGGTEFPDCLIDTIHWDAFPVELLKRARRGDVAHFRQFLNTSWHAASTDFKEQIVAAVESRCERLEKRDPSLGTTQQGLFALMSENGLEVEAALSTQEYSGDPVSVLTSRSHRDFSTLSQSAGNLPWMELKSGDTRICPRAVGLRHGFHAGQHECQTFVVEAAIDDSEWTQLVAFENAPLSTTCELRSLPSFPSLSESGSHVPFFNRFRIRMTGPDSSGGWHLCLCWFDIFGTAASKETLATLRVAAESALGRLQRAAGSEESA